VLAKYLLELFILLEIHLECVRAILWSGLLNQARTIKFAYHCEYSADQPNVTMVDNSEDCAVTIHISTVSACPSYIADGNEGYTTGWHHFHNMKAVMIGVWVFVALSACICCCACCALLRRRRCQNGGSSWCRRSCSKKGAVYTELSTKVDSPAPISQPQIQPTAPVAQQPALVPPQYYPVQYIPAQQYYMMQQQFMQQQQQFMQQQPQQQQQPVVELESISTDAQVDADEKLARELQAKFNAEH
jgi:hypothetical protein